MLFKRAEWKRSLSESTKSVEVKRSQISLITSKETKQSENSYP